MVFQYKSLQVYCLICEDNTSIQILSDNNFDPKDSIHYKWGDMLLKVAEKYDIDPSQLWDSEADMKYLRNDLDLDEIYISLI